MGLGSSSQSTGKNFWSSFARVLCLRSPSRLKRITNGETEIWAGPILRSSADVNGKTTLTTETGLIHFYWGKSDQNVDALLALLQIDRGSGLESVLMPAFRRCCYYVAEDNAHGQQVTPGVYKFELEFDATALDISTHLIDGDAVVPEVIYELLTDTLVGAGISAADLWTASFEAGAEVTITEGIGASPDLDATESWRDHLGRLLAYIDGHLVLKQGKLELRLTRPVDTSEVPVLTEADMLEEPEPVNEQYDPTWNQTVVGFRDRDNKWEESTEPYDDPANAAIVGQHVPKEFNFPYVTRRAVAYQIAKRLGIRGGLPAMSWRLTLKPQWRHLLPGDVLKVSYAALGVGERVIRVRQHDRGTSTGRRVMVEVYEDMARDTANDYVPAAANYNIPATLDPSGSGEFALTSTVPRLSWLPADLKDGKADGVLVAMQRTSTALRAKVWWTRDPGEQEYSILAETASFPAAGQLQCWHQIRTDHWLFRVEMAAADDRAWLQSLVEDSQEVYCVVGQRLYKTVGTPKDEHQVLSPWLQWLAGGRFELLGGNLVDIELEGAAFSTDDLELEGLATDGKYPALQVYFGRREDFFIHTSDTLAFDRPQGNAIGDTDQVRYFKATLANLKNEEAAADVTASEFDRDDTTMCADGTYSEEWGAVVPTTYQLFNEQGGLVVRSSPAPDYPTVADIDAALGAIFAGTATATQILLAEEIDAVLGNMITTGQLYYAP